MVRILKDSIKIIKIIIAERINIFDPSRLYNTPPARSPIILAVLPRLLAYPCIVPWNFSLLDLEINESREGHMIPLPTANNAAPK